MNRSAQLLLDAEVPLGMFAGFLLVQPVRIAGRARGRMESWQKWSFPVNPPGQDGGDLPGWRPVRKRRRICRFSQASRPVASHGLVQHPQCAVELTEVFTSGQDWWTLGFEATGPEDVLSHVLRATAARVFAQAMPGSMEPGPDASRSYMEWLRRWPGTSVTSAPEGVPHCGDTGDMNRERAETHLRQLAEAELRGAAAPRAPGVWAIAAGCRW